MPKRDPRWKDYRVEDFEADGRTGKLVSYVVKASRSSSGKRFAAVAVFPGFKKVGKDSVGLTVITLSATPEDRGWAGTALRSIRRLASPALH